MRNNIKHTIKVCLDKNPDYYKPWAQRLEELLKMKEEKRLEGVQLLLEKETDKGRIDAVLELSDKVYIIEFKFAKNTKVKQVSTLSRRALKQIKTKKYYEAYLGGTRRVLLLGLGFLDKELHGRVEAYS